MALSVIPTCLAASVSIPGSSPVHCSVLSGLSYPVYTGAIVRLVANGKNTKITGARDRRGGVRIKWLDHFYHIQTSCYGVFDITPLEPPHLCYLRAIWEQRRTAYGLRQNSPSMCRILILDDDPDILELCSIILRARGYHITTCTDCKDVLTKVKEAGADVVLIDNWIPDIGGIRAAQQIKLHGDTKHIPVVFFSASNNVEVFSREAQADYFLQKPFDIAELENIIDKAAQKSRSQSQKV